jgi:hypothetical protein
MGTEVRIELKAELSWWLNQAEANETGLVMRGRDV